MAQRLLSSLETTAGLAQACKLGLASKRLVKRTVRKAISKHGRLRWRRIFRPLPTSATSSASTPTASAASAASAATAAAAAPAILSAASTLPVKLEIASGTGDWVVAQAQADVGKANWACVELRHDRVYHTVRPAHRASDRTLGALAPRLSRCASPVAAPLAEAPAVRSLVRQLSLMALQAVPNLCVMGGDAALIVRSHLQPASVSHAFINFPE